MTHGVTPPGTGRCVFKPATAIAIERQPPIKKDAMAAMKAHRKRSRPCPSGCSASGGWRSRVKANREKDFVDRICSGMRRFSKQAAGARDQPANQLCHRNYDIGQQRDDDRARAFSSLRSAESHGGTSLGQSRQHMTKLDFLLRAPQRIEWCVRGPFSYSLQHWRSYREADSRAAQIGRGVGRLNRLAGLPIRIGPRSRAACRGLSRQAIGSRVCATGISCTRNGTGRYGLSGPDALLNGTHVHATESPPAPAGSALVGPNERKAWATSCGFRHPQTRASFEAHAKGGHSGTQQRCFTLLHLCTQGERLEMRSRWLAVTLMSFCLVAMAARKFPLAASGERVRREGRCRS